MAKKDWRRKRAQENATATMTEQEIGRRTLVLAQQIVRGFAKIVDRAAASREKPRLKHRETWVKNSRAEPKPAWH
jgi:hypothetical protein